MSRRATRRDHAFSDSAPRLSHPGNGHTTTRALTRPPPAGRYSGRGGVRYPEDMRRLAVLVAAVLAGGACSACGPETTSFRTTDRTDPNRIGPPSAGYDVYVAGQLVAKVHVWSSGG